MILLGSSATEIGIKPERLAFHLFVVGPLNDQLSVIPSVLEVHCFRILVNHSWGFDRGISKIMAPWMGMAGKEVSLSKAGNVERESISR